MERNKQNDELLGCVVSCRVVDVCFKPSRIILEYRNSPLNWSTTITRIVNTKAKFEHSSQSRDDDDSSSSLDIAEDACEDGG